jgi:hypothetical protein
MIEVKGEEQKLVTVGEPLSLADRIAMLIAGKMSDDALLEKVEAAIDGVVDEAVKNSLKTWGGSKEDSTPGKVINEVIQKSLRVSEADFDLPKYHKTVAEVTNRRVEHHISEKFVPKLQAEIDDIIGGKIPDEISFDLLMDKFRQHAADENFEFEGEWEHHENYTAICERGDGITSEFWHIYLHPESDAYKYQCAIQIDVMVEDGKGKVYGLKLDSKTEFKKGSIPLFFGPHYGFEKELFLLYANQVPLVGIYELDENSAG